MQLKNNYCVYIHKLKQDGRIYVGQTGMSLKERSGSNGHRYKNCTKFYNAIQKYGWDSFEHIIIQDNLTLDEANTLEAQLIQDYDSINNGFNINLGGRNHEWTDEQRRQQSLRMTGEQNPNWGKPRSAETRRKIGEANRISQLGRHHSEETKQKMSLSHKKYKPVICVETGKIYYCAMDAALDVANTKQGGHITEVCKGKRQSAYGLHWKFYNIEGGNY